MLPRLQLPVDDAAGFGSSGHNNHKLGPSVLSADPSAGLLLSDWS